MTISMSQISECDVTDCSYNLNNRCRTIAITVGDGACPMCDTYVQISQKGGAGGDLIGGVGACRASECVHNRSLECTAGAIKVGRHSGHADCVTFAQR